MRSNIFGRTGLGEPEATDVIVVGSGAAGLTAAVVAAQSGFKVTLFEATEWFGGTTAFSGGGAWIPMNHHMPSSSGESYADAQAYLKAIIGNFYDEQKVEAYLNTAPKMLKYMEENTEVSYLASSIPDYEPSAPGWKIGRCLLVEEYNGEKLGSFLKRLRPPIPEFCLLGSMQVSIAAGHRMQNWNNSLRDFMFTAKRFAVYGVDRLRGRRGRFLANGNALVGRLLRSALDGGVRLVSNSRVHELIVEGERVTGVLYQKEGEEKRLIAHRGVVLATGGFGANPEMRRKLLPQADAGWSFQSEGSQGDGINMGVRAGGKFVVENAANAIWAPASSFTRDDGTFAKYPSLVFDRHCPGSILVDTKGKRFVDESFHYQNLGEITREKSITKYWMISHAPAVRRYGMGAVKPAPFTIKPWVDKGYIIEAQTISALAVRIGLDPIALEQTVLEFNQFADSGVDLEFHRGENYYSAYMGDSANGPNPALGALREAPFYALELRPSDLSTLAGLATNASAQVVRPDGSPIDGLYAAGVDNNNFMRGKYPAGGASIGPGMTFAYIAVEHMRRTSIS